MIAAPSPPDSRRQRPRLLAPFEAHLLIDGFRRLLPVGPTIEPHLRGAIVDTLEHPGSLVRAQLAYGILRQHATNTDTALATAIAIEYFHTASLLFDDMPAMDDARQRRGHPCPHVVYGEAATTLAALALITRAYNLMWRAIAPLPADRHLAAARLVSECLGVDGILNGQAYDIHFAEGEGRREDIQRVAQGKTVSLIRLTLLLPALVAGVTSADRQRLDRLATLWGLSYQILDDFKDHLLETAEAGKSTGRDRQLGRPNLPARLGSQGASAEVAALLDESRDIVDQLSPGTGGWPQLETLQAILEEELRHVTTRLPVAACA